MLRVIACCEPRSQAVFLVEPGSLDPNVQKKEAGPAARLLGKDLAATYSRGGYTTTTIGNAAFDVRVRDGIGSGRSFVATKKK
jgi:hypothetical protein